VRVIRELSNRLKSGTESLFYGGSIRARVFRGGASLGTASVVEQAVRFGRNMIVARLLAPNAFGTMAILLSASSLLHTITDIGVREAIIQNPRGTEKRFVNSAFWLGLLRACSLACILFIGAPWIAQFYGNVELTRLLRVVALTIIIDSAGSPLVSIATKNLKFYRLALINHGGGICGVILTVIMSYYLRDVWALVLGLTAESLCRFVFSYVLYPYWPSLHWDGEAVRELLKFSRGIAGLSFLNLIFSRTDIFVMAKLYPATQLGLYAMAIYLAQTPTSFLMNTLGQTLLPTFSHLQQEGERINRILIKVSSLLVFLGLPALAFAYFCGRSLLTLAYGARYSSGTNALTVAALVAVLNLLNGQITTVFYAKGLPQLHRRSVALMAIIMIIAIYPCAKYFGIAGGQVACLIAVAVGYVFQLERVRRITGLSLRRYGKPMLLASAASLTVVAVCLSARLFTVPLQPSTNILVGVIGCFIAYVLGGAILLRSSDTEPGGSLP
jgi:lipopolysaccharide exporter